MEYYTQAIVLSKSDVKEYDRLFSLYTKNLGKALVIAKGVRRIKSKMAGHLEPFGLLAVKIVSGRGMDRISNVETIQRYQNIAKNLESINLARYCLNLINELVKEGSCDLGILQLLNQALLAIDNENIDLDQKKFIVAVFSLQLLTHLGYRPELYNCLECQKKVSSDNMVFNAIRGGVTCVSCNRQGLPINQFQLETLRSALDNKLEFFMENKIKPVPEGTLVLIRGFIQNIRYS